MAEKLLNIAEIAGTSLCVGAEDGGTVFAILKNALSSGEECDVSFAGVEMLTSAFLNTAFGQLYGAFPEDLIRAKLRIRDMSEDDKALLKRVNDTAKLYYKDPDRMERSAQEILGDD